MRGWLWRGGRLSRAAAELVEDLPYFELRVRPLAEGAEALQGGGVALELRAGCPLAGRSGRQDTRKPHVIADDGGTGHDQDNGGCTDGRHEKVRRTADGGEAAWLACGRVPAEATLAGVAADVSGTAASASQPDRIIGGSKGTGRRDDWRGDCRGRVSVCACL